MTRRGALRGSREHGRVHGGLGTPPISDLAVPGLGLALRVMVRHLHQHGTEALRALARNVASRALARPLLRAMIGRWPTRREVTQFHRGFRRRHAPVPPLLRALAGVPAARPQLTRAMLASWIAADEVTRSALTAGLGSRELATPGDVLRVWRGPPISFLHLEKTAGMSVSLFLEGLFHPTQIDPDLSPRHAEEVHVNRHGPRPAFIRGHYDLPKLRRTGLDRFVLTFLREPRARLLSLYYFWRSHTPLAAVKTGVHPGVAEATSCSLLVWLRSTNPEVRNAIDNFYVRRLTGVIDRGGAGDTLATDPDRCLEDALQALASMEFVGITEQMDASLSVLGRMLEFAPPPAAPRVNVAATNEWGRSSAFRPVWREPITPEIDAELTRLTRLDRVIYDAARTWLADQHSLSRGSDGFGPGLR